MIKHYLKHTIYYNINNVMQFNTHHFSERFIYIIYFIFIFELTYLIQEGVDSPMLCILQINTEHSEVGADSSLLRSRETNALEAFECLHRGSLLSISYPHGYLNLQ